MNRSLRLLVALVVVAAACLMPGGRARACSFSGPSPYVVDASMQATDHVAPTLPPVSVARLQRGEKTGGCTGASTCDGFGSLALSVAPSDDVTPANAIGYRFSLAAGALPPGFSILLDQPSQVVVSDGEIWFNWTDGTDDHAPIDFTLRVTAIDRAGNESAPQMVRVIDDPGGCAIARPHARGRAWLLVVVMVLAARHRRRRRT
jgi:hypothetical protein